MFAVHQLFKLRFFFLLEQNWQRPDWYLLKLFVASKRNTSNLLVCALTVTSGSYWPMYFKEKKKALGDLRDGRELRHQRWPLCMWERFHG